MEKKVFRSSISILLILFILATVLLPVFLMAPHADVTTLTVLFSCLLFCIALLAAIRYEIEGSTLRIKLFGFTSGGKIDIRSVCLLKRSYNPLSSPASSLKRLAVYRTGKFPGKAVLCALISPADEKEFIKTLKSLNPAMKVLMSDKTGWWRFWDWDI
jgi:hypothetical protein